MKKATAYVFILFLAFTACKEPFEPEVDLSYKNLLVVEGFINIGGETTIRLSRNADLKEFQSVLPEKNALIRIEGNQGTLIQGTSVENGKCVLDTRSLLFSEKYRLIIGLAGGAIYQTDYMENKVAPEIDSLNFRVEGSGFQIFVNTHDETNNTRYYNWDYSETWEIKSAFQSYFQFKNNKVSKRDPNVEIFNCWSYGQSSQIILGTTERLSEDKLSLAPLAFVPGNSIKLAYLYSILVRQYGLTKEAYQYLEVLKKNTENIGTIFDSQPSELKSNIICVSKPEEKVIGWISAGRITEKRLFISARSKPRAAGWVYPETCTSRSIPRDSLFFYIPGNDIIDELRDPFTSNLVGYTISTAPCIDCTLRGSNIKPSYWPN